MGITNVPESNDPLQWGWDFYSMALASHVKTYTYKLGGVYNTSTGEYVGGVVTGYKYQLMDGTDAYVTNEYYKKA